MNNLFQFFVNRMGDKLFPDNHVVYYGSALSVVESHGLTEQFKQEWGIAGDWEDPEDGSPIPLDKGELTAWINKKKGWITKL